MCIQFRVSSYLNPIVFQMSFLPPYEESVCLWQYLKLVCAHMVRHGTIGTNNGTSGVGLAFQITVSEIWFHFFLTEDIFLSKKLRENLTIRNLGYLN